MNSVATTAEANAAYKLDRWASVFSEGCTCLRRELVLKTLCVLNFLEKI